MSSNYGSVFYLTTGFHGLHVTGGLIAFIFLLGRTYAAKRFTHEQQVSAIVVSYYWHFVDVVWIGLFTTIYLTHQGQTRLPINASAGAGSPATRHCCSGSSSSGCCTEP